MRGRGALLLTAVALAAGLGLFVRQERLIAGPVGFSGFPLDDSWIHFQFARNLASGQGFAFNPGVSVAGSTAPLWTLVLAALFKVGGVHPAWAKAAGIAAALGAAWLARRLALAWTGDSTLGLTAALVTAASAPMIWGALSGMEVTLAALLVTGAFLAHTAGRTALSSALVGLAVLARPESVLLVPLFWLAGPLGLARAAAVWGIPAALLAPWVAFNLRTAGTPLPATATAKVEGGLLGLLSGARESTAMALLQRPWQFEREWIVWLASVNLLLPVLVLPGLWVLWRRRGRACALPASILLWHPLGMALLAPYRGPGFQEGRYSIQLLPLGIVVAVTALALSKGGGSAGWLRRGAMGLLLLASLAPLWSGATRYAWAVQNIDAMQVTLGRWVEAHTPPGSRLALNDVGAITFLGRREVTDVMGLVTPAILPYRRDGEAGVFRYLEAAACPDYLIIFPEWFPGLSARADRFTPIHRVVLEHNTVAGAAEMVVYETVWNRWRPNPEPCPGRR